MGNRTSIYQRAARPDFIMHRQHFRRCGCLATGRQDAMQEGCEAGSDQSPRKRESEGQMLEITLASLGGMVVKQVLQHAVLSLIASLSVPDYSRDVFPNFSTTTGYIWD